jgi:hypothetical protein
MTGRYWLLALGMIAAAPVSATQSMSSPSAGAPSAPADALYCLRVDPPTGSRLETVRCETREGWARLEVDLDHEWAEWGVRIVGPAPHNA